MATRADVIVQIQEASRGIEALLNNDLEGARKILGAQDDPFHLVGRGITAFLAATLSREDAEVKNATDTLVRAEASAIAEMNSKRPKGEIAVYPAGTEFKLLTGDATIGQALVAILSESYVAFAGALFKLNRAYKIFGAAEKVVFPNGVGADESLESIFAKLNAHYLKQTTASSLSIPESSGGGGFFSWGRKKGSAVAELRHSASSATLSSAGGAGSGGSGAAQVSASEPATTNASVEDLKVGGLSISNGGSTLPTPLWVDDPLVTMIISGAALGSGMFGLIFSMIPPRMRKMIGFFGFSGTSRAASLKLLTVAASTGNDVHGYFASLTLCTFYGFVLLMSGWQAEQPYILEQYSTILNRVIAKFPSGTLWQLNRAKLARMQRNADTAIEILEAALAKESTFREADSLLVFELSWLYLSQARFLDTASSFEKMNTLNKWSPSTYVAISSGALIDHYNALSPADRTPDLIERIDKSFSTLPTLFLAKRLFGEKPVSETFIARRYEAHKAKLARWIASGRVKPDAKIWEVVRITNALELGLFWATIGNRSQDAGMRKTIEHLSSFSPAPRFSPSSSSALPHLSPTPSHTSSLNRRRASASTASGTSAIDDLDTPDELAIRDLLLGVLYSGLGDSASLLIAQQYFSAIFDDAAAGLIVEESWVPAFARFHSAVTLAKEGDLEEAKVESAALKKEVWTKRLAKAETLLEGVFGLGEYDLKSRLESRVLILKDELQTKKRLLGLL